MSYRFLKIPLVSANKSYKNQLVRASFPNFTRVNNQLAQQKNDADGRILDYVNKNTGNSKKYTNSLATRHHNAHDNENNKKAGLLVVSLRNGGKTWDEITATLNDNGFKTRRDCMFVITQTVRLYDRYSSI